MNEFEDWLLWLMETNDTRAKISTDVHREGTTLFVPTTAEEVLRERGVSVSTKARCPWVLNGFERDRLYSSGPGGILDRSLARQRHELILHCDEQGLFKQIVWQPMPMPTRGFVVPPGFFSAALFYRERSIRGGDGKFATAFLAINKTTLEPRDLEIKNVRTYRRSPEDALAEARVTMSITLSAIEDAMLKQWWHVYVRDEKGRGFKVPATPSSCRKLLQLRDGPTTASGRRKALVHWVRAHSRSTVNGTADVERYLRGVETVKVDDQFTATIDPRV